MPTSKVQNNPTLCIRFACDHCQQQLHLPLRRINGSRLSCPQCAADLTVPPLNGQVEGIEVILDSNRDHSKVACPGCRRSLKVTTGDLGKCRKCPACHSSLTFKLVNDEPIHQTQLALRSPRGHACEAPEIKPVPLPSRGPAEFNADDAIASSDLPNIRHVIQDITHDEPPAITYGDQPNRRQSGSSSPFSGFSFLMKRRLVYAAVLLGFNFVFLPLAGSVGAAALLVVIVLWWLGYQPLWVLSRKISAILIRTIICPGCGIDIDAVSRWELGGYRDHRERHILNMKNPLDKKLYVSHVDCPHCQSTILV